MACTISQQRPTDPPAAKARTPTASTPATMSIKPLKRQINLKNLLSSIVLLTPNPQTPQLAKFSFYWWAVNKSQAYKWWSMIQYVGAIMLHHIINQILDYFLPALLNSVPRTTQGGFNRACRVFRMFPPGFSHPDKRILSLSVLFKINSVKRINCQHLIDFVADYQNGLYN